MRKTVYVVTTEVPGDVGGAPIRNYQLIKQLVKSGDFDVTLISLAATEKSELADKIRENLKIKATIVVQRKQTIFNTFMSIVFERAQPFMSQFRASGLNTALKDQCDEKLPDILLIEQVDAYYCVKDLLPELKAQGVKVILDQHNIEIEALRGAVKTFKLAKKLAGLYLIPPFERLELEAVNSVHKVLACSDRDTDYFKRNTDNQNIFTIPNGVDSEQFSPSNESDPNTVLFMGGVAYPANADAMRYYINEVHPIVRKKNPNVKLKVIGATQQWISEITPDKSIEGLGFVASVVPYVNQASIGICPIRQGSGTRHKVLCYMSAELCVVSTSKGSEGIDYVDGRELLIGDDAESFANKVCLALDDALLRKRLGKNGRKLILQQYDWDVIGKRLIAAIGKREN